MLVDTHCHLNMLVKGSFDMPLTAQELDLAATYIEQARASNVTLIINVGTSTVESKNCIELAQKYAPVYAVVGIHPNDCTPRWQDDLKALIPYLINKEKYKIVGIGECGLDFHYPHYNKARQKDAFKAQIELALTYDIALVVHSRDAADETLRVLEEYKGSIGRSIIHCFSEDQSFATTALEFGCALGIGGTLTYPKNAVLRSVVLNTSLSSIVLETDTPFLPPQSMRGKQNTPAQIATIAQAVAELKALPLGVVAEQTTATALRIFALEHVAR